METTTVTFNVEGKWFTWILRHLWIEGNEVKALKMWIASFPEHASIESLNKYFIPIVSGKKKFTGMAALDGFGIAEDHQKYWDSDRSGRGNPSFPLLQSWHDVILLKKTRMFVAEMHLRAFRLNRRFPYYTHEGCGHNSLTWIFAVEENKAENTIRNEINRYWMDIRNLSRQFAQDLAIELLPTDDIPLKEGPTFKNKKGIKSIEQCLSTYDQIRCYLAPVEKYFNKKYGKNKFLIYSDEELQAICGIEEDDERYANKVVSNESAMSAMYEHWSVNTAKKISGALNTPVVPGAFGIQDVETYVRMAIKDGNRESIEAEDTRKTEWQSGYIDPEGHFYGCSDLNHKNFSVSLCEKFGIKDNHYVSDGNKMVQDDDFDAQVALDEAGWVKVSMGRFYWTVKKLTEEQKVTIHDYMRGKSMVKALFNTSLEEYAKTFQEAWE
jgi:hypothetical protein